MAGTVIVPWYATGFRADAFEKVLGEVAATALRYGATSYDVYRARDDRYKFQQLARFEHHLQWDRYWSGPEMTRFRIVHSGWYQVPVVYGWWDRTAGGEILTAEATPIDNGHAANGAPNGHGARGIVEGESA
ncbi:MAG TPA: hypothetical protein VGI27_05735 [Solirubrobacteraceae bacterium]